MVVRYTLGRLFMAVTTVAVLCTLLRAPPFAQPGTGWNVAALAFAFSAIAVLIVISSKATIRTIAISVGSATIGMLVGNLLSADSPPECVLPGAVIGWSVGCMINLFMRHRRAATSDPDKPRSALRS